MRRLNLIGVGAVHTLLLVVLPALHVSTWTGTPLPGAAPPLMALPFIALVAAAFHPRRWLTLGIYPLAHLPVLVVVPELTGRLVYEGPLGLAALAAVALVAAAFTAVAVRMAEPPPATPRARWRLRDLALPLTATATALLLFGVFLAPVLLEGPHRDPAAAQLVLLIATAVAGWFGVRVARGDIADLWLDPRAREPWLGVVLAERRASAGALFAALASAIFLATVILAVYGLGS
ncbi:MAG: hypothetical protein H6744_04960 [Deltaproteobacteria bacterium]|nr:hypothetical protein [Deltaproteobacteria bacterium]MCB9786027.1 hypothetical protein [Deltaproteobacteria bacterium]